MINILCYNFTRTYKSMRIHDKNINIVFYATFTTIQAPVDRKLLTPFCHKNDPKLP